jgi:hypothetical protein
VTPRWASGFGLFRDRLTQWQHAAQYRVIEASDQVLQSGMHDDPHTYRPRQHTRERWFGSVVRPSIPEGEHLQSVRDGDTMSIYVPEFNDSGAGHWSFAEAGSFDSVKDLNSALLYRNGTLAATSDNGAWGDFRIPAGNATYRLDLSTGRTADEWHFGTSTRTSWTFRSGTTPRPTLLPLLQVDYDVPVDALNAVGRSRTHKVGLTVRMQDGMAAPSGVSVTAETSYDDGVTWHNARTARRGHDNRFTAVVERPADVHQDAYVTLRITASDASGNRVRQTVQRACLHPGTHE